MQNDLFDRSELACERLAGRLPSYLFLGFPGTREGSVVHPSPPSLVFFTSSKIMRAALLWSLPARFCAFAAQTV